MTNNVERARQRAQHLAALAALLLIVASATAVVGGAVLVYWCFIR